PGVRMPPLNPMSNLPLAIRYAPSNAVPPPLGKLSSAPNSARVNARYGALKVVVPVACAAAPAAPAAPAAARASTTAIMRRIAVSRLPVVVGVSRVPARGNGVPLRDDSI